jgi:hypothetical protein
MEEEQAKFKYVPLSRARIVEYADDSRERVVYAEIEGIKNGEWDYKLTGASPPVLGEKVEAGALGQDAVHGGDVKEEREGGEMEETGKDIGTKDVGDALDDDALVANGGAVVDESEDIEMEG